MRNGSRVLSLLLILAMGIAFNFIAAGKAQAGTYLYNGDTVRLTTDPISQTGSLSFNYYAAQIPPDHMNNVSITGHNITVRCVGTGAVQSLTATLSRNGSYFYLNGGGQIPFDNVEYKINIRIEYQYFNNITCGNDSDTITKYLSIPVTGEMYNREPAVSLSPCNNVFSEVDGYNQLALSGTVADPDNDNVTVSVRVRKDGSVIFTQDQSVLQCGSGKPFSFLFTIDQSKPEGTYTIDLWANDGK